MNIKLQHRVILKDISKMDIKVSNIIVITVITKLNNEEVLGNICSLNMNLSLDLSLSYDLVNIFSPKLYINAKQFRILSKF